MLKIAIQRSGRLHAESSLLLRSAGIGFSNAGDSLISSSESFPAQLYLLRDDDIPYFLRKGIVHVGIAGLNVIQEYAHGEPLEQLPLGFAKCRLSLAVPKEAHYQGLEFFNKTSVATSFPNILRRFFDDNHIDAKVVKITGSVEVAPHMGICEGVLDVVQTGKSLFDHGLKEVHVVMDSEATLFSNPDRDCDPGVYSTFIRRVRSVVEGRGRKYVVFNILRTQVKSIDDPKVNTHYSIKSPTVAPLANARYCSVHVTVKSHMIFEYINHIGEHGATDILVLPIENLVP